MSITCPYCGAVAGYGQELGHRSSCPTLSEKPRLSLVSDGAKLKCPGAGRDAENERALCFYFNRRVTDEEMRYLHEVMQRAAACHRPEGERAEQLNTSHRPDGPNPQE